MSQRYETVLFDFGGTLDADGEAWKERIHRQYRAENLRMNDEAFDALFYAADDGLVGRLSQEADLAITVHRLMASLEAELARREGSNEVARAERTATRFLAEASASFERNRPLLQVLGERYQLGVVSNFYGNLEAVCRGAGLAHFFAVMVDSQCVGAEKPDPTIFRAALRPLGATPERTVLVGDSLRRDREGARRMGMDFIWIAPKDVQQAETRNGRAPLGHPAVARFGELAEILT
jgi:HAD superfamily hydrolase (TIGR01549 family)